VKGAWLRRQATRLERWLMRGFDRVSTISQRMCDRLRKKGVDDARILLLPNWVDAEAIHPLPEASPMRAELGVGDDQLVALYAGNMAAKQGLETLIDAARRLEHRRGIVFVFAGAGPSKAALAEQAAGLSNVRFLPLQPLERLNKLLNLADLHMLPQKADAADLVMPSKLSGMFASGRAVIACANPGTELEAVVKPRGVVVPPEDGAAFAAALERLAGDPQLRRRLGAEGRTFVEAIWSRTAVIDDFDGFIRMGSAPRPAHLRERPYFARSARRAGDAVAEHVGAGAAAGDVAEGMPSGGRV